MSAGAVTENCSNNNEFGHFDVTNMAAAKSAEINVEGYHFVSFKQQCEDTKKITRKRHLLNVEALEFYPPEGHLTFSLNLPVSSKEAVRPAPEQHEIESDSDEDNDQDTTCSGERIFYVGGARNSEEATWGFSSTLYYYDYDFTKNDLWIENGGSVKLFGATMPALSKSACVNVNNLNGLLIWGGINLTEQYGPSNDLIFIQPATCRKKVKYNVTIFPPNDLNIDLRDEKFASVKLQCGDIPCARFGHTITKVQDDTFLMFGGLTMPNISNISADCSNLFMQCHTPLNIMYTLNISFQNEKLTAEWKSVFESQVLSERSFHTATYIEEQILVIGGAIYEEGKLAKRISISDAVSIKCNGKSFSASLFKLTDLEPKVYL